MLAGGDHAIVAARSVFDQPAGANDVQLLGWSGSPATATMIASADAFRWRASGEAAALRWRHYDPAIKPLGKLLVAKFYNTRKNRENSTKTDAVKHVLVHPVLAAMLRPCAASPPPRDRLSPSEARPDRAAAVPRTSGPHPARASCARTAT